MLTDPDEVDTTDMTWQWYRAATPNPAGNADGEADAGTACNTGDAIITPTVSNPNDIDSVNERRHFLESASPGGTVWDSDLGGKLTRIHAGRRRPRLGACGPAVAYSDDAGDPTSQDDPTTTNDEELEATYAGTEWPVKKEDTENDAPIFTVDGMVDNTDGSSSEGEHVPQYLRDAPNLRRWLYGIESGEHNYAGLGRHGFPCDRHLSGRG